MLISCYFSSESLLLGGRPTETDQSNAVSDSVESLRWSRVHSNKKVNRIYGDWIDDQPSYWLMKKKIDLVVCRFCKFCIYKCSQLQPSFIDNYLFFSYLYIVLNLMSFLSLQLGYRINGFCHFVFYVVIITEKFE